MKTLIAISSCERDAQNGFEQAMRDTWLRDLPEGFGFVFFRGIPSYACGALMANRTFCVNNKERCNGGHMYTGCFGDSQYLAVNDDYQSLPFKTRESCRWALENDYDFVFRAFTDTCVHPQRLAQCGFENFDYCGHFPGGYCSAPDARGWFAYASGGPGYWLSRRACEAVVSAEPDHWAEDLWVGNVMGRNGFATQHDPRFFFKWSRPKSDTISVHLSRGTGIYEAPWMAHCYRELLAS